MVVSGYFLRHLIPPLLFFILASLGVHAQESASRPPRHAIKFSPLHLLNPELASIQIAYEYRFAGKIGLQLEGGYVFGERWWIDGWENVNGFKFKEDVRWYFYHKQLTRRFREIHKSMYLAFELHQNRIEYVDGIGGEVYRQYGSGVKAGFIRYSRWGFVFDFNAGFSVAKGNIMAPMGIPLNSEYEQQLSGNRIFLLPIVGLRVGHWVE